MSLLSLSGVVTDLPRPLTDAEKAESYRKTMTPLLEQVVRIIDLARKEDGLTISFNIAPDQHGRHTFNLSVVRPL